MFNLKSGEIKSNQHYYGDIVRLLYLSAAIIMLVFLPLLKEDIPVPVAFSVAGILGLVIVAGLMNPIIAWVNVLNVLVSIIGFIVFSNYSVTTYAQSHSVTNIFMVNMVLSLIFIFSIYFSIKTLRGKWLEKK